MNELTLLKERYQGHHCTACGEGSLSIQPSTYIFTYLNVYELTAFVPKICCNVCGASIIPNILRDILRKAKKEAISKLYYE